jgi:hypothetical protein
MNTLIQRPKLLTAAAAPLLLLCAPAAAAQSHTLRSPDGRTEVQKAGLDTEAAKLRRAISKQ